MEVVIKIDVKDNNVEQALRVLKRKLQRDGFFKVIKLKNTYEKPSEKKTELYINFLNWLRGTDLNRRPSGYEPDELPDCSTPRYF